MKNLSLILAMLICSLSFSQDNKFILNTEKQKDETRKVYIDINQDGKVDRIEFYKDDQLLSVEIDTHYNGKFDEWISYTPFESMDKAIQVTKKDTNGDGKVDRIEKNYKDFKHSLLITTVEIDSKFSGQFDVLYTNSTSLNQKKDIINCAAERSFVDAKVLQLSTQVSRASSQLNADGYIVTEMGYKIHKSCMDRWGTKEFPNILKTSMNKGMHCLADLAVKNASANATPNGAKTNLDNLKYLQQSKGVTIVCDEDREGGWTGVAGHASTNPTETMKNGTVKFPFISLNPNDPKIKLNATPDETNELMGTIFHEQLHNLGFSHGSGVEFPYTCEVCCVANSTPNLKDASCKVCAGAYQGADDKVYVNDMITFMRSGGQSDLSLKAAINYLKEAPNDREGIFALANASTDTFSPMGMQMSLLLKNKFKDLKKEEKSHLDEAESNFKYGSKDLVDPTIVKISKLIAQGYITHYYDHNTKNALDEIEKNKALVAALVKNRNEAKIKGSNKMYMYDNLKTQYEAILVDIWLHGFPKNNPDSKRAFRILNDLKLI